MRGTNRSISSNTIGLHDSVKSFLASPKQMLIGQEWTNSVSDKSFSSYNPSTGEKIVEIAQGDARDIDRAVQAARQAFESGPWTKMSPSEKGKILWRIGDLILEHREALAQLESIDNGKPVAVARVADVPLAADLFHYMAGWATKIEGQTIPVSTPVAPQSNFLSYTVREPIGVVGQIIPWNFPLLMAAWKLGPVLATGNTVVLKPAEQTPLSALYLGQLMLEAGLPEGVLNIVPGFGEAGAALTRHDDVDKVAFTGSTEVGQDIVKAASGNLKRVSLELGGKSPNIIFKDVKDLDRAIEGAANAIFFNHGQCCCAGSRLFVEKDIYDRVIEGVAAFADKINMGHGMDESSQMGPLVSQEQLDKVSHYLDIGNRSAQCVTGGKRIGESGFFVTPTVYADSSEDSAIVQEEIFGPVVVADSFENEEDLVRKANRSIYGLAAGVWTSDVSKAHKIASKIRAGSVWVNCYNVFDSALPFGGYKQSGWGREMGKEVLSNYTETKAVTIQIS